MSHEINFINRNVDPCFGWWMSCSWMALWSAGHVGIHSTATSYILHLQSTTGEGYPLSCWFSNLVGVGSIPLYLALVVPLSVLAGHHYYDAMRSFEKIHNLLLSNASTWTDGTPVNLVALLPAVPLLDSLTNDINRFMTFFRAVFIVYAFTALFLAIVRLSLPLSPSLALPQTAETDLFSSRPGLYRLKSSSPSCTSPPSVVCSPRPARNSAAAGTGPSDSRVG